MRVHKATVILLSMAALPQTSQSVGAWLQAAVQTLPPGNAIYLFLRNMRLYLYFARLLGG